VLSSVGRAASGRLEPRVGRVAHTRLLERAIRVELAIVQDAEFHNLLASARRGALAGRQVTAGVVSLVEAVRWVLATGAVLAVLHPVLLPLLLAVVVPPAWGAVRSVRTNWQHACVRAEAEAMHSGPVKVAGAPRTIVTQNLTFTYLNADRATLQGADVVVRQGEVVALVGENGSGKTTLAKLLGLYLRSDGAVLWDGCPTTQLDRAGLFEQVALVSQDFVQWPFTARSNVTIGRPDRPVRLDVLAEAARFGQGDEVVRRLPSSWDTLLAREFRGGTEFSPGSSSGLACPGPIIGTLR
jgi:ATP-binding cassette subfamily B protein